MRRLLTGVVVSAVVCALAARAGAQEGGGARPAASPQTPAHQAPQPPAVDAADVSITTGAVIELTLDQAGRVINTRVVSQATRP